MTKGVTSVDTICKPGTKLRAYVMFGICFLFLFCLMNAVPLTSDDLEFSELHFKSPAEILNFALYYGNGRVLGNLGAVCLVNMPILAAFLKAFILSGIIFMVPYLLGHRSLASYLMSFLLFILVPGTLFASVYSWTCGFQNYLPPIWITLVILLLLQKFDAGKTPARVLCCVAIFLLGIAGQLYVEHSTLIQVVLAASIAFIRFRKKENIAPALIWFIATVAGAACMFLVPVIFFVEGNRVSQYALRSVNLDSISSLVVSCVKSFAAMGKSMPFVGTLALSGATIVTTHITRSGRSKKWNAFLYLSSIAVCCYTVLNEWLLDNDWLDRLSTVKHFITACFYFAPILLWGIALFPLEDKALRNKIYFLLGIGILSIAPLLVVSPTPDRVIFIAYVCIVASLLVFVGYLKDHLELPLRKWIKHSMQAMAIVTVCLLCVIFSSMSWMCDLRIQHIENEMAAQATQIEICRIPYDYEFYDGFWAMGRKYYYEEWNDIKFVEMDFSQWYQKYYLSSDE